jgi:hypothetical protein
MQLYFASRARGITLLNERVLMKIMRKLIPDSNVPKCLRAFRC